MSLLGGGRINGRTSFCPLSSVFHTLHYAVVSLSPATLVLSLLLSYCFVQLEGNGSQQDKAAGLILFLCLMLRT